MGLLVDKIGKQGRWPSTILVFLSPILIIFGIRWFLVEPFVIPSESMVPNLLVHDHILVSKYSYGLKWPIGDGWLVRWNQPERGDVVVFRFPEKRDVFYIKRLIGLPGDKIKVQNGQITINGQPWVITPTDPPDSFDAESLQLADFTYFLESTAPQRVDLKDHYIRLAQQQPHRDSEAIEIEVQNGQYFVMGDNRDQSYDSRYWGAVPEELLVGRAFMIWMSCSETLASAPFLCDPFKFRRGRFAKFIE